MLPFLLTAALVGFALFAFAMPSQDEASPTMPGPGAAHRRLAATCGEWNAIVEGLGPPAHGKESVRSICGGFWVEADFQGELFGQPFSGRGLTGVDPATGKYVGIWVDSSGSPLVSQRDGEFSKDGKTLTFHGEGFTMDGKPAKVRYTTTFVSDDERRFEITQVLEDGSSQVGMTIRYSRAK